MSWQTRLGGGWDHVVLGAVVPGGMPGVVVPGGMPGVVVPGGVPRVVVPGAVVPTGCLAWYQLYEPGVPRVQRLDPTSEKC